MSGLFSSFFSPETQVLVAFSCGSDSVYLVSQLLTYMPASHIHLVYCDHGLRLEEVRAERQFLREFSEKFGVTYCVRTIPVQALAIREKLSLEAAGRKLRYRVLGHLARLRGISVVLTGHHANDNVETVLHHIIRGTAKPPGIAMYKMLRASVAIVRPLLQVSKKDILLGLQAQGLTWMQDSSNEDIRFTRNKIRHHLIPVVQSLNSQYCEHIGHFARHYKAMYDDIFETLKPSLDALNYSKDGVTIPFSILSSLSVLRQSIFIRDVLNRLDYEALSDCSSSHIESVLFLVQNPESGKSVALCGGYMARCGYDTLFIGRFEKVGSYFVPIQRFPSQVLIQPISCNVELRIDDFQAGFLYKSGTNYCYLSADNLDVGRFFIRNRSIGDYFHPFSKQHPQRLSRYLIEKKVPRHIRNVLPLFFNRDVLVWVPGFAVSECVKITSETKTVLSISLNYL